MQIYLYLQIKMQDDILNVIKENTVALVPIIWLILGLLYGYSIVCVNDIINVY